MKKIFVPFILYCVIALIQWYGIGRQINSFSDEGVYLYSAKLILQGYIPYKDFFLAHPPLIFYLLSGTLSFLNFNLNLFHYTYVLWVLSIIFPLYFLVLHFTKNHIAAFLSILLFATFPEFQRVDVHTFAVRQASIPFFGFSFYFFFIAKKPYISLFFLFLFAASLVSNIVISLFVICLFLITQTSPNIKKPLLMFFFLLCSYYTIVLLLPNAFQNIILYQINRPSILFINRLTVPLFIILSNISLFSLGLLGMFVKDKTTKSFSLFNIANFLSIIFLYKSFYYHYFSVLGFTLPLTASLAFYFIGRKRLVVQIILVSLIMTSLLYNSYSTLRSYMFGNYMSGEELEVIDILSKAKNPIFSFQPIYVLYAKKELTFHYHTADMRYFDILPNRYNLTEPEYMKILSKSNTILIEYLAYHHLPKSVHNFLQNNLKTAYKGKDFIIYTR